MVFTEETNPQTYVKLVASGVVDDSLLEAGGLHQTPVIPENHIRA
jgi:hypothetical protein